MCFYVLSSKAIVFRVVVIGSEWETLWICSIAAELAATTTVEHVVLRWLASRSTITNKMARSMHGLIARSGCSWDGGGIEKVDCALSVQEYLTLPAVIAAMQDPVGVSEVPLMVGYLGNPGKTHYY